MTASAVQIIEVSPRDGLQNEPVVLAPDRRIDLISRLVDAGVRRMESVSFVHPTRVPTMAGAEEVMAGVPRDRGVSYIGLALNERGTERAIIAAVDEVNFVLPVTDSFANANQNSTVDALFTAMVGSARLAAQVYLPFTVTLAVAFGCPFEGDVPLERTLDLVRRIAAEVDVDEIALADTIGCAVPAQVAQAFTAASSMTAVPMRAHFHETRHTGLANAYAALGAGVRRLDSSAGGLGGCPFAPGAAGNLATEDLLWMLQRSHPQPELSDSIDVDAVTEIGRSIADEVGGLPRSAIANTGYFPRTALGARVRIVE